MTTLYLVPLPFGSPDDVSLRALRILREVSAVASTDVEAAHIFLALHEISRAVIPYDTALDALTNGSVALLASSSLDAAAQEIVREAVARSFRVEPLPGADAAVTALVLSGLPTDAYAYFGVLPDELSRFAAETDTMIFTTANLTPTLERLAAAFGARAVSVAALTHPAQIVYRAAADEALAYFRDHPIEGEVLLVVAGAPPAAAVVWEREAVLQALRERLEAGEPLKLAAKAVANQAGWDRRTVYALGVEEKRNTP